MLFRHTVPSFRGEDAKGKDRCWYEAALHDGNPIIVYLHGSAEHRSVSVSGLFFFLREAEGISALSEHERQGAIFNSVSMPPHNFFPFV